jgi:hypothetical protein
MHVIAFVHRSRLHAATNAESGVCHCHTDPSRGLAGATYTGSCGRPSAHLYRDTGKCYNFNLAFVFLAQLRQPN